jgi:hypothetical protein
VRQINYLSAGESDVFGAGSFEATHALEHQRGDR